VTHDDSSKPLRRAQARAHRGLLCRISKLRQVSREEGIHRFCLGKIFTGTIYLLSGGLLLLGVIYDYWTLNDQIDEIHYQGLTIALQA
jgi:hypothetical protein